MIESRPSDVTCSRNSFGESNGLGIVMFPELQGVMYRCHVWRGQRMNQMTRHGAVQHPLLMLSDIVTFVATLCAMGIKES